MANLRNEFEFKSGLLDALGVEHTEADAKVEERWRAKMLDGLGVEYNQNDVNQFDLFRAKLLEGVEGYSGGGGGTSYTTLFEGSVTTTTLGNNAFGTISNFSGTTADTIKVTFNGTEYTCEKNEMDGYGAPENDWSEYPFVIVQNPRTEAWNLITESPDTYTLKIEAPQSSGGSGDFSTAWVTIVSGSDNVDADDIYVVVVQNEKLLERGLSANQEGTHTVVLYKGRYVTYADSNTLESVSGEASYDSDKGQLTITGDCTLTLHSFRTL